MNYREQAQHFLEKETEFHLGDLVTEQSHPVTRELSGLAAGNTAAAIKTLFQVDR